MPKTAVERFNLIKKLLMFGVNMWAYGCMREQWIRHLTNWFWTIFEAAACFSSLFINPFLEFNGVVMTILHTLALFHTNTFDT